MLGSPNSCLNRDSSELQQVAEEFVWAHLKHFQWTRIHNLLDNLYQSLVTFRVKTFSLYSITASLLTFLSSIPCSAVHICRGLAHHTEGTHLSPLNLIRFLLNHSFSQTRCQPKTVIKVIPKDTDRKINMIERRIYTTLEYFGAVLLGFFSSFPILCSNFFPLMRAIISG